MILGINKYNISKQTDRELIISVTQVYIYLEIGITILGALAPFAMLEGKIDFNKIEVFEVTIMIFAIVGIFNILKNLKLLRDGEDYVFNKDMDTITKNGTAIGRLSHLQQISIVKQEDSDSAAQYELRIDIKDRTTISFQHTSNLDYQRNLATAISKISDVPFKHSNEDEVRKKEEEKHKAIELDSHTKVFQDKFKGKSTSDLEAIAQSNGRYAEYAQKAAQNLLKERRKSE